MTRWRRVAAAAAAGAAAVAFWAATNAQDSSDLNEAGHNEQDVASASASNGDDSESSATTSPDEEAGLPSVTLPAPLRDGVDRSADSRADATTLRSPPRLVEIPTIGVTAEVIDLGLTPDGSLETPTDFDETGWWAGGSAATESGPTVIVGHVDSFEGPAVFFRLAELEAGDHIVLTDAHDRVQRFRVDEVSLYDKTTFPTDRVYGPSDEPTLRLITCGGDFDDQTRSYEANWVVFATPV